MEYTVIKSKDLEEFKKTITELLNDGWSCIGGLSVDNGTYNQGLINYGHKLIKS